MLLIIEGMAMCLIILLVCVIGIAHDGPAGLVTFYEQDVKDRVIELGLTTPEKIRKSTIISGIAVFIPVERNTSETYSAFITVASIPI